MEYHNNYKSQIIWTNERGIRRRLDRSAQGKDLKILIVLSKNNHLF